MTEFREIRAKSILNRLPSKDDWFQCSYTMNIYRGCEHGCTYCDGRSRKYWPSGGNKTFSSRVIVKANAPSLLKTKLMKLPKKEVIALGGGVNDSWQPCEERYGLTRKCLEILMKRDFPVCMMTKSELILRDMDIIKQIAEKNWCFVAVSLSTVDEKLSRIFEPNAPSPKKRLDVIKRFADEGITAGVCYMPIIPYLTDSVEQIEKTIAMAKDSKASFVLASSMTLSDYQKKYFMDLIKLRYRRLVPAFEDLYRYGHSPGGNYQGILEARIEKACSKHKMKRKVPEFKLNEDPLQLKLPSS